MTPAWQKFLSAEAEVEEIDWTCRRVVYEEHLDEVEAAIDEFDRDHAAEIEAADEAWIAVEESAAALGYHGQSGSVD